MEFIGNLLGGIVAFALFVAFFWGFFYLIARVSKYTGKTYVFRGGGRVTPHSFDAMTEQLESGKKAISSSASSIKASVVSQINKEKLPLDNDSSKKKLEYLEMLGRLRQSGTITQEEFDAMKKDILK